MEIFTPEVLDRLLRWRDPITLRRNKMKKTTALAYVACLFMLISCGADHSRHFPLTIYVYDDASVCTSIEALVEKSDNTEKSTSTTELKGELSVPLTGGG